VQSQPQSQRERGETMSIKDDLLKSIDDKIDILNKRKDDLDWLPELPQGRGILTAFDGFRIAMPFDRKLMHDLPAVLAEQGFELFCQDLDENKEWYPNQDYKKRVGDSEKYLNVGYFDFEPGSVCKKRYIGKVTVEKDVYEFSCVGAE